MKYKVGDKVRVAMLEDDTYYFSSACSIPLRANSIMCALSGQVVTISAVKNVAGAYHIAEDLGSFYWSEEMFTGLSNNKYRIKGGI